MNTVINWLSEYPLVWELALFPLVTFVVTALLKPRTPEQYAELPPRVAAALKLVAAVGWDAPKIVESIGQLVTGRARSVADQASTRPELDQ